MKEETHIEYKNYRHLICTPKKKIKQAYYNKYFEINWNNIRNTWKETKFLTSSKSVVSYAAIVVTYDNGNTITNPYDFDNSFKKYFASIAETTKK